MLHLYCIVPRGRAVPATCQGLDGREPFAVESGDLAVWVTEHEHPPAASIESIRTHNDVVMAALDGDLTPVPVRFGQYAADLEGAADRLAQDSERWLRLLARFAGRAEYGVRAVADVLDAEQDVHAAKAASGTEYMAALVRRQNRSAERRQRGERIAALVAERAGALSEDVAVEYPASGTVLVSVAHLVAWEAAEAYHGAMREVSEAAGDTRFVLSGPWPPYSFVE